MISQYLYESLGKLIIKAASTFVFVFLCAFIPSVLLNYNVDYISFFAGAITILLIFEVISYKKWVRSN